MSNCFFNEVAASSYCIVKTYFTLKFKCISSCRGKKRIWPKPEFNLKLRGDNSFTWNSGYSSNSKTVQQWKKYNACVLIWDTFFSFSPSVAGLRLPVYKALACRAPVLPAAPITAAEPKPSDIDVSDLGSRNYGARSDFYCLVTEEDIWSTLPSLLLMEIRISIALYLSMSIW